MFLMFRKLFFTMATVEVFTRESACIEESWKQKWGCAFIQSVQKEEEKGFAHIKKFEKEKMDKFIIIK